jgi:hypothetical protein
MLARPASDIQQRLRTGTQIADQLQQVGGRPAVVIEVMQVVVELC